MTDHLSYQNPDLPIEQRVDDLLSRMTLEEKCGQMLNDAPAVERLGIPAYNWWSECLHGVARAGIATVFPQAIGLAAMWNEPFLEEIAVAISDEARAKHHDYVKEGEIDQNTGLTFWSPNVNIFRDPRWGRGHETYGECPYLSGRLGVAFCKGLQGNDERYLKVVATPKHYAVHSGPEHERHSFDATVSEKDLWETYLPAFHTCVTEAQAWSIMGAYNRTNGEPCCGSVRLLQEILRDQWGFEGYVVSDCGAIGDFHEFHKVTDNAPESAAQAVKAGCDLNCGCVYGKLVDAVELELLTEDDIDRCVRRLMVARMKLGMFDPPERVHFTQIPYEVNDCDKHREMALEAARQSMVLLKNDGMLPLPKELKSVAVIGPNAYDHEVLMGNYEGQPSRTITPLDGIREAVSDATKVYYAGGCHLYREGRHVLKYGIIAEAVGMARRADAVVMVLGLSPRIEGEGGDPSNPDAAGDKLHLDLPGQQQELLEAVCVVGKPVVLVLIGGSALAVTWAHERCNAVIQAWYPGQAAGTALAEILFGDYSPAARLPVTFVRSLDDLPDFRDYSMKGRTYRYLETEPLYPFGYGLSYTTFDYSSPELSKATISPDESIEVSTTVTNTGAVSGDEVVQLYVKDLEATVGVPNFELRGFQRVYLKAGESAEVRFGLLPRDLSVIDEEGKRVLEPGRFAIFVGGSQPDSRSVALTGTTPVRAELEVTGEATELPY